MTTRVSPDEDPMGVAHVVGLPLVVDQTISYDEFERTYEPVKNQLDSNASYNGCMFETFGEELEQVEMVVRREPGRVWTIIDGDDGVCIVNGAHFVNRLGYLVTKVPAPETASITVEDE